MAAEACKNGFMLPARLTSAARWVTPETLNVTPQLVGMPLALPQRRVYAMAIDLVAVALLSSISGLWLVGGLLVVALQLHSRRGATASAATSRPRLVLGYVAAGLIVFVACGQFQQQWQRWQGRSAPVVAERAPGPPESAAEGASAPPPTDAERIVQLEQQLAQAQRRSANWRVQFNRLLDQIGLSFGWGIVYFSLLPAWWGGQTLGKKLLGLRVVELTGKPMTVLLGLKRYGGYAAGMATGGLGFAQALWDANRQGLQDKAAHTVVIDLRALPRGPTENAAAAP
jgi:hypothetical protein